MSKPFVSNLEAFKKSLSAAQGRAQGTVTRRYRNYVTNILHDLAANTPQWSGDLAASWQVMVGAKNQVAMDIGPTPFKAEDGKWWEQIPKAIGSDEAVKYALRMNKTAIDSIRWNSIVTIQNVSNTLTEGDDEGGPLQESDLRPYNFIPGDFMAVHFVADKYSRKNVPLRSYNGDYEVDMHTGEYLNGP